MNWSEFLDSKKFSEALFYFQGITSPFWCFNFHRQCRCFNFFFIDLLLNRCRNCKHWIWDWPDFLEILTVHFWILFFWFRVFKICLLELLGLAIRRFFVLIEPLIALRRFFVLFISWRLFFLVTILRNLGFSFLEIGVLGFDIKLLNIEVLSFELLDEFVGNAEIFFGCRFSLSLFLTHYQKYYTKL